jgi:hypothetical protein
MSENLPIYILPVALLVTLPGIARPDPAPELPRDASRALTLRLSFWSGPSLRRLDGSPVALGTYGAGYESVFAGSPDALEAMRSYRTLKIAGTAARTGGFATMVAALSLTLAGKLSFGGSDALPLLLPSLALELTSQFLSRTADVRLSEAVDRYNAGILAPPTPGLDPRGERLAPHADEVDRHRFLSLSLRF